MRIAILLYGYFYIDENVSLWRAPHSVIQLHNYYFVTDSYKHVMSHIYYPLKTMYHYVDVYMITHEFPHPNFKKLKKNLLKLVVYLIYILLIALNLQGYLTLIIIC
jgi:hypothetical protein